MVAIMRLGAATSLLFGLASQAMALSVAENHAIVRALHKDLAFENSPSRRDFVDFDKRDLEELQERYYDHLRERASRGRAGSPPPYGRPGSPMPPSRGNPPRYGRPAGAPPQYTQLSRIREGNENKKKKPTKNQKKQAKRQGRKRRKQRAKKDGRRSLMDEFDGTKARGITY
ncbi:unnamed protein product [Clonostachys rosea]|uniref:Uncharacterized protein n=1 Tax=Bionectria ochroleuca TaxID=29856 RepID=A0ABY6UEF1_BIOOC|nr:unnamed protein product [Clonostachys rosea]